MNSEEEKMLRGLDPAGTRHRPLARPKELYCGLGG